jgi:hypothetical protein
VVKREDTEKDRKKLLLHYFADRFRIRLLHVSRGFSGKLSSEVREGVLPDEREADLINIVISEPNLEQDRIKSIVLTRRELLEMMDEEEISPYTGDLEKKSREYIAIKAIFDRRRPPT